MSKEFKNKPLAVAVGAALATSLAAVPTAEADASPFSVTPLPSGYMVAATGEGSCGEGKKGEGSCGEGSCGEDKKGEGSCGEGSCGEDKKGEGTCGEGSCGDDKKAEGSCGEGSCGADKGAEGSCGDDKAAAVEEAAPAEKSGGGSTGLLTLLALLSAIGLRRRS